MKTSVVAVLVAGLFAFTSCSTNSYPGSTPYPSPYPYPSTYPDRRNDEVIVTRDGTVIDRNGRVLGNANHLPPGQAKKIFGTRSARPFAPGQRKKQGYYDNRRYEDDRYEQHNKEWKGKGKGHGRWKHRD